MHLVQSTSFFASVSVDPIVLISLFVTKLLTLSHTELLFQSIIGLSGLSALSRNYVSTIYGVFSLSLFLPFRSAYFSPRRGYLRVPKFCMGFYVLKDQIWVRKQIWGPQLTPDQETFQIVCLS
jgi:hypothetical protein